MQDKPSIAEIVERWMADNNGKITGDINARVALYFHLFAALEEYGYTKADVRMNQRLIKDACFNEHARVPSAQKQKWKDMISKSFERAIVSYPPWTFKMATFDPEKTPMIKTEYPEIPPEMMVLPTDQDSDSCDTDKFLFSESMAVAVERAEYTPEEWEKLPSVTPEYDEELRQLLGFKK